MSFKVKHPLSDSPVMSTNKHWNINIINVANDIEGFNILSIPETNDAKNNIENIKQCVHVASIQSKNNLKNMPRTNWTTYILLYLKKGGVQNLPEITWQCC